MVLWKCCRAGSYTGGNRFLFNHNAFFFHNTLFFITMNLDQWNALTLEVQAAIERVNEEYFEKKVAMGRMWDKQNEAALKWAS